VARTGWYGSRCLTDVLGVILVRLGERARDLTERIAREDSEQFRIDARDFLSARERVGTTGTRIEQQTAALSDAAEIVNRSFPALEPSERFLNAISPVAIPNRQSLFWRLMPIGMMLSCSCSSA
jgi:hypothetical protein